MKPRFRTIRWALCLAAFLPVMLGGGAQYVLCLGEGGRLAVETANDGRCIPSREEGRCGGGDHEEGIHDESERQCGPCTDLPLTAKGTFIGTSGVAPGKSDKERNWLQAGLPAIRSLDFEKIRIVVFSAAPPPDLPVFSVLRSPIIRV